MRKLLVPVAFWASLLVLGTSGCKLYRVSSQPENTDENERLRARIAELEAAQASRKGSKPSSMSPGAQAGLEREGIKVSREAQGTRLTLSNKILFSAGSAALRTDSKRALDEAAKVIRREFSTSTILIQGHTDNQPIVHSAKRFKSNHELSVARAKAVAAGLQKAGLKNRLKVEGYGETRPLNGNRTNEEKAQNRRVEIFIADPGATKEPATGPSMESDEGF